MAMFKLLHLWSSWEATGEKKTKRGVLRKIFLRFLQCVKLEIFFLNKIK